MPAVVRTLLVALALGSAPALAAEPAAEAPVRAQVTAGSSAGFGRVLFDWSRKVQGKAQLGEGVLVITFDRAFDADTAVVQRALEPLVALVRLDPDHKTLRLALKGPVRVKTTDHGTRFAFDIIPPSYRGEPPPVVPPVTAEGQDGPAVVPVRVSERERLTRVQFDWPSRVEYTARMAGGKLTVAFSRPAKIDLKRFAESPPAWIRGARATTANGKIAVEFDVDAEADFKDVSEGNHIAFEVREPVSDAASAASFGDPQADLPPPALEPDAETLKVRLPPRKKPQIQFAGATLKLAGGSSDAAAVENGGEAPPKADPIAAASPLPPALRPATSDLVSALTPPPPSEPVVPGKAKAEIFGTMLRLELPYSKLPPAAMFRRGLAVWIVIGTSEPMDLSALTALPNAPARLLSTLSEVAPGVTAFRLETPAAMTMAAMASGQSWVLTLGPNVADLPAQVRLVRQVQSGASKVRALLPGSSGIVWLKDPQTEDRIAAVLAYAPARGLVDGQRFVEFAALSSMQGLAIEAIADDLSVAMEGEEAVIARPHGLNLSVEPVTAQANPLPPVNTGPSPAFIDFAAWRQPAETTRSEAIRKLMRLSAASAGGMSPPRMALARYYIAEGLGSEALGVLNLIEHDDKTAQANPHFRVAHALANILVGRHREAIDDLSMDALGADPNAALWRGLAAAGAREWRQARSNLMVGMKTLGRYPPEWQARIKIALARTWLELGDASNAQQWITNLPRTALPADLAVEVVLVRARLEEMANKPDTALILYEKAASSPYRPAAMRAHLERTLLRAKLGKIKPAQAIDELERVRFQWRGDDIELRTLTELGNLYVAQGRYRDGLDTMRLAVRHFAQSDESRETAIKMAAIFEDLFLNGKADTMPPVQALGIFFDFRELTPVGAQGDEMIRKLADRLVSVELLGHAADLLQHQVDQRLEGIAKASVATRLAVIYLSDRKPEKALAALRASKQTRLPDDLLLQRNLLEARALNELKQYDQALEMMAGDDGAEAVRLRADVLWDARRWPDAAAASETMLGTRFEDQAPLSDAERTDVMRTAVAYSLAGDIGSLMRLRTRYGAKMAAGPDSRAFDVVTQAQDTTGMDYRNLVKRLAGIDTFEGFMKDFRARFGDGGAVASAAAAN